MPRLATAIAALAAVCAYIPATAVAEDPGFRVTQCVYDYRMLSEQECRAYRTKVLKAKSADERIALHENMQRLIAARASERGVSSDDWRGLSVPRTVATGPRRPAAKRECAYDYPLLTEGECRHFYARTIRATSHRERAAAFDEMHRFMRERAAARGVSSNDWLGFDVAHETRAER